MLAGYSRMPSAGSCAALDSSCTTDISHASHECISNVPLPSGPRPYTNPAGPVLLAGRRESMGNRNRASKEKKKGICGLHMRCASGAASRTELLHGSSTFFFSPLGPRFPHKRASRPPPVRDDPCFFFLSVSFLALYRHASHHLVPAGAQHPTLLLAAAGHVPFPISSH